MTAALRLRLLFSAFALVACVANVALASAQSPAAPATIRPEVASSNDSGTRVDIRISNVEDLGAFEFVLVFDGNLAQVDRVEKGEFLGSSGREVLCLDPTIDTAAVRYECVTLGAEPVRGSDGSGVLASVFLTPKAKGKTAVELTHVKLQNPTAVTIDSRVDDATLEVFGHDGRNEWIFWSLIAGGTVAAIAILVAAGGVLLARRQRAGAAIS